MNSFNSIYFRFRNWLAYRLPHFYNFCDQRKSVVKFIISGIFAGTTQLIFLAIFFDWLNWSIVLSASLAFVLSFLVSFSLQKIWTFRNFSQKKVLKQFSLYIINAIIALNVNGFFMHLLVERYDIWYLFSQIVVNVSLGIYNFFFYRLIVFKDKKNEVNSEQKEIGSSPGNVA